MKFILASSSTDEISEAVGLGLLHGIAFALNDIGENQKGKDEIKEIARLCSMVMGPVFVRVDGSNSERFLESTKKMLMAGPNLVPSIPCTHEGIKACRRMKYGDVTVCVHGVKDSAQALVAARAGAAFVFLDFSILSTQPLSETVQIFKEHRIECEAGAHQLTKNKEVSLAALAGAGMSEVNINLLQKILS